MTKNNYEKKTKDKKLGSLKKIKLVLGAGVRGN